MWAVLQSPISLTTHSTSFLQDNLPTGSVVTIDSTPVYTVDKESPQFIVDEG